MKGQHDDSRDSEGSKSFFFDIDGRRGNLSINFERSLVIRLTKREEKVALNSVKIGVGRGSWKEGNFQMIHPHEEGTGKLG